MPPRSRPGSTGSNDTLVEQPSTLDFNVTSVRMKKNVMFADKLNDPRQKSREPREGGSSSPIQTKKLKTQPRPSKRPVYVVTNCHDDDLESLLSGDHAVKGDDKGRELLKSERESPDFNSSTRSFSPSNQSSTLHQADSVHRSHESEEPSLPAGWERRIDPRSGEPYYVDHAMRTTSWSYPTLTEERDELGPLPLGWGMIPTEGGKTIFVDHKTRTTTWLDPRKLRVEETPSAQFLRKALYLERVRRRVTLPGCFEIKIRRSQVLQDSYPIVSTASLDDLKRMPKVMFEDDDHSQNHDAAGEWFDLLLESAFDPNTRLFVKDTDGGTKINPQTFKFGDYLECFRFIGRIHGMALLHGFVIDPQLVSLFYPLVRKPSAYKWSDKVAVKNLVTEAMTDAIVTCFKTNFGNTLVISSKIIDRRTNKPLSLELRQDLDGCTFVSQEDHEEFAHALAAYRAAGAGGVQLRSFMDGFWDVIPSGRTFWAYNQSEVEKLVGGITEFEQDDDYSNLATGNTVVKEPDECIKWFWTMVRSWPVEHRQALLRYVTGFKRLPATDKFKVLEVSDGPFSRFTARAVQEPTVLRKVEITQVHVLSLPRFDTPAALEKDLLHVILNTESHEPNFLDGYFDFKTSSDISNFETVA